MDRAKSHPFPVYFYCRPERIPFACEARRRKFHCARAAEIMERRACGFAVRGARGTSRDWLSRKPKRFLRRDFRDLRRDGKSARNDAASGICPLFYARTGMGAEKRGTEKAERADSHLRSRSSDF